jgi:cytidylate kinase
MSLITISGSIGSGAEDIARAVAEAVKLPLYDDKKIQEEGLHMGIHAEDIKEMDEKAPGLLDRLFSHNSDLYLNFMEAIVYEISHRGEGVIIGHGSQMLLRDFGCALHVLVHAPEESRIKHVMEKHGLSEKASAKLVHKKDQMKKGFMRFAFDMEYDDPSLYDLVINSEKLGADIGAKMIIDAATHSDIKACGLNALSAMERFALEKKILGYLTKKKISTTMVTIEVEKPGHVHLGGLASTSEDRDILVNAVKEVPGVTDVKSDLTVMPYQYA